MSVAVIADAHIDGPGGEPGPLIEQLRELGEGGCRRLILLERTRRMQWRA